MSVSYEKLWRLLKEHRITRTQLCEQAHITTNAMAKLGRDENVRVDTLVKICTILNCTMNDIMDLVPEKEAVHG